MWGSGLAGGGVLRRALLQRQAGRGLLRPLLGQRSGDGRGDGVYHLDPSDGDHREGRTHLELRMEGKVTEQDLVRWAGLVATVTALVVLFPW